MGKVTSGLMGTDSVERKAAFWMTLMSSFWKFNFLKYEKLHF